MSSYQGIVEAYRRVLARAETSNAGLKQIADERIDQSDRLIAIEADARAEAARRLLAERP